MRTPTKENNPQVPISRRPDIIHVAGKYAIFKKKLGVSIFNQDGSSFDLKDGEFQSVNKNTDRQAIVWTLDELQKKATASSHIIYNYEKIINKVND